MKLEVLMSCMHQADDALVRQSGLTGDVVVINQCDRDGYDECATARGTARTYATRQRGLTRSRNLAIRESKADVCMLCDDDEVFVPDYEQRILEAYEGLPQADVIVFKMVNHPTPLPDRVTRLKFPRTMQVSSWQISFRRQRLLEAGVWFDELLGAGSGNGAEEELKFLLDCERAGLAIWYVPVEIARVGQEHSTWFSGFTEEFFENRGATTRYILGLPAASAYAVYYVARKRKLYGGQLSPGKALLAIFRGIREDKITRQARERRVREETPV